MAMGRLNRPSIMVYGGTIKVGDLSFCICNILYGASSLIQLDITIGLFIPTI